MGVTVLHAATLADVLAAQSQQEQMQALAAPWAGGNVKHRIYGAGSQHLRTQTLGPWTINSATPRGLVPGAVLADTAVAPNTPGAAGIAAVLHEFRTDDETVIFTSDSITIGSIKTLCKPALAGGSASVVFEADALLPVTSDAPAAGVSPLTALIGDSLTEHAFGSTPFYWQNGLIGGQLELIANSGHSGQTLGGFLGQIENDYTAATAPGLIGLPALGWVFFRGGTNNIRFGNGGLGTPLDSTFQGNYIDIIDRLLDFAEHVVVLPVPPIGGVTVTKNIEVANWNAWLQAYVEADTSGRLHWIDDCADLVDGSGNVVPEFFMSDELHMIGAGSRQMALTAQTQLEALLANQGYGSPLVTDPADVYPAQPQWTTNPTNTGTGGTFGSGWSGQAPNGWRVETNGSGLAGAVSIVAADVGDPNQTPWVRITPSAVAPANIAITMDGAGRSITSSDPDTLEQLLDIRFNAFTKFSLLETWAQAAGNRFTKTGKLMWDANIGANERVTLRQKFYRNGANAGGTPLHYIYIGAAVTHSGSCGSIDLRCWSVRG